MEGISLLIALGVIVGSNNLAVALALGALGQTARIWRIVFVFGAFEFWVPLIGLLIGRTASQWIEQRAGWLSILLLIGVGVWMIWSGFRDHGPAERLAERITTWRGLAILAALLSIDNLVIGFSLGLLRIQPLAVAFTISVFSMAFTWLGIRMGNASRRHWERIATIASGILLLLLAVAKSPGWL